MPWSGDCRTLSEALAYAAGLIDGEGCIGTYWNSVHRNFQLRITVEMTEKVGLEHLEGLFGGKWYFKPAKTPRKARHLWMIFNSKAENAIKQLLPYLKVKKEHAETALKADWTSFKGKRLTEVQKQIREGVNITLKELNERGYYQ